MKIETGTPLCSLLLNPTDEELKSELKPHNADKLLEKLYTGQTKLGEVHVASIEAVVYNPFSIRVFYKTVRPNPSGGEPLVASQFMDFWPNTATMRCLAVTRPTEEHGPRVVMIQEYRTLRAAWTQMLVAGGDKKGKEFDVLLSELMDESGSKPTPESRIMCIGREYMDDGLHAEPLTLLTIDMLDAPDSHVYVEEQIRGVSLVPWHEWRSKALRGEYHDIYCTIFAARCDLDKDGRIVVNGKQEVLRG